jgi:5-hydroxyisourate hydrolase
MNTKSPITTHVLDTSLGRPADGIAVTLLRHNGADWIEIARGNTDNDGRISDLLPAGALVTGRHRLVFATREYHERTASAAFYTEVIIDFNVADASQHYHVPLLLSPFGYSTYRGS